MVKNTFTLILLPAYFHWLAVKLSVISLIRCIDLIWFFRQYISETGAHLAIRIRI